MMSKIFVGNPANRISIAGIKSHPWFTKNLPDELKVSSSFVMMLLPNILCKDTLQCNAAYELLMICVEWCWAA